MSKEVVEMVSKYKENAKCSKCKEMCNIVVMHSKTNWRGFVRLSDCCSVEILKEV